jgi:hypothetical protein
MTDSTGSPSYVMKLSKQECGLIVSLRESRRPQLPDWAMTIEYRDGAWDIFIRGMIGGKRGTGPTFEAAWDAFDKAELEDLPFPPL